MRQRLAIFFSLLLVTAAFSRLGQTPLAAPRTKSVAMAITVWTTEDAEDKAQKVVAAAEKLADATVRVEEIKSYYWWDDKVNFDPEWRVVVTTTSPFDTVQEVISKVHSYDLPMIIYDLAELPEGHAYWKGVLSLGEDAIATAETLVEQRIVACAQAAPDGTLAVKTMAPCKALVEEHASKTGRSVSWTAINGNEGYLTWMKGECTGCK